MYLSSKISFSIKKVCYLYLIRACFILILKLIFNYKQIIIFLALELLNYDNGFKMCNYSDVIFINFRLILVEQLGHDRVKPLP